MNIFTLIKNILKFCNSFFIRHSSSKDLKLIKRYMKEEKYKIALNMLDEYIGKNKLNSEAYYLRHFCHLQLNNFDNYIQDLNQSCQLFQYENNTHMYRQCMKELGDWV